MKRDGGIDGADVQAQTQAWREAFDQSFVHAPQGKAIELHDYLAIQAGSERYALRLNEVAGLQALKRLTPCPSRRAELLGLSSFRGKVLPVYDLRVLLGVGVGMDGGAREQPAWWIAAKDGPLGLAFDVFERHLRLPDDAIARAGAADSRLFTGETLRSDDQLRPIVSIRSILQSIRDMVQQHRAPD